MRTYENPFQELEVPHQCLAMSWMLCRIVSRFPKAVRAQVLRMIKATQEESEGQDMAALK